MSRKVEKTIKELRTGAKLTQESVARALDVSLSTFLRWERANNIPKKRMRVQFMEIISKGV